MLITRFGVIQPVKWVGRQSYDARFIRNNRAKIPVHIRAGALSHKLPARDLFLSPGHSVLLDDQLILASSLVNGVTVTQNLTHEIGERIEYYQVELEGHDCIVAEGT
jgi:Hint domain